MSNRSPKVFSRAVAIIRYLVQGDISSHDMYVSMGNTREWPGGYCYTVMRGERPYLVAFPHVVKYPLIQSWELCEASIIIIIGHCYSSTNAETVLRRANHWSRFTADQWRVCTWTQLCSDSQTPAHSEHSPDLTPGSSRDAESQRVLWNRCPILLFQENAA